MLTEEHKCSSGCRNCYFSSKIQPADMFYRIKQYYWSSAIKDTKVKKLYPKSFPHSSIVGNVFC